MAASLLLLLAVTVVSGHQFSDASVLCPTDQLVQYKIVLETFWNEDQFPRHYPKWRPNAQWTKLLGLTHSPDHVLFRESLTASDALKVFVEKGDSDQLDRLTYASQGTSVLDSFYGPAITEGVGTTEAMFFADGNHSMVSVVSKIVPSPDWFIGVDSLQLCSAGHWINATSLQLSPMDGGTDQGLAFTSPSWAQSPPDPISRITHTSQNHPAASFFYPNRSSLPVLASLSIAKVREYRLVTPSSTKQQQQQKYQQQKQQLNMKDDAKSTAYDDDNIHSLSYQHNSVLISSGHTLPELSTNRPLLTAGDAGRRSLVPASTAVSSSLAQQYAADQQINDIIIHPSDDNPKASGIISISNNDIITNDVSSSPLSSSEGIELRSNKVMPSSLEQDKPKKKRPQLLLSHRVNLQRILEQKKKLKKLEEIKSNKVTTELSTTPSPGEAIKDNVLANRVPLIHGVHMIPKGDAMSVIDSIVESYQREQKRKRKQKRKEERRRRRLLSRLNGEVPRRGETKRRHPVDCEVGEWSAWSACSKTCDIGEQTRSRPVLTAPRRRGVKCPPLVESTWCGSARGCGRTYFKWSV